jgi:hypothetical protein
MEDLLDAEVSTLGIGEAIHADFLQDDHQLVLALPARLYYMGHL